MKKGEKMTTNELLHETAYALCEMGQMRQNIAEVTPDENRRYGFFIYKADNFGEDASFVQYGSWSGNTVYIHEKEATLDFEKVKEMLARCKGRMRLI